MKVFRLVTMPIVLFNFSFIINIAPFHPKYPCTVQCSFPSDGRVFYIYWGKLIFTSFQVFFLCVLRFCVTRLIFNIWFGKYSRVRKEKTTHTNSCITFDQGLKIEGRHKQKYIFLTRLQYWNFVSVHNEPTVEKKSQ